MEILLILVFIMLLLMMFTIFFVLGAWCGFKCKGNKKTHPIQKAFTEQEIAENKRAQKELENFMNYTGKPQDAING